MEKMKTCDEKLLSLRPLLLDFGCCLSAGYMISAMATTSSMSLAPFGILLQFLVPWTDSLRHVEALELAGRSARKS